MNGKRWIPIAGLVALLLGGGILVITLMNRPMGQTLTLQTPTQYIVQPSSTPKATSVVEETPAELLAVPSPTMTIQPTDAPKVCGNSGSMNLLLVALTVPKNTESKSLEADAIRLVTINFDQPSATILAIPPALWVDTPVLADLEVEETWLKAVYEKTYLQVRSESEGYKNRVAIQAMAQTILDNFSFSTDHYITIDERVFIEYVDRLGGVEVNLPKAVDGSVQGFGKYPAGIQTLDGLQALNLASLFYPVSAEEIDVWGNMDLQNLVMRSILEDTLKPQNWTKIPGLIIEGYQRIFTDLSPNQILDLTCMADEVGQSIQMLEVSEGMVSRDETGRMIPDVESIKDLVAQMGPK